MSHEFLSVWECFAVWLSPILLPSINRWKWSRVVWAGSCKLSEKRLLCTRWIKSSRLSTSEDAIYGMKVRQSIGASVNLSLHNFSSNGKILLEAMPIEDRAKYLKDLDLRHDALLVQNLIYYDGMFQNRQSKHRRNEKLKPTSFFSRTDLFSTKENARSKRSTPQNRLYRWNKTPCCCAQEEFQSIAWSKTPIDSPIIEL